MRLPSATPSTLRRLDNRAIRRTSAAQLRRCYCSPAWTVLVLCLGLTGCTSLLNPISGVPARRLPPQFLAEPRADKVPIDLARLRQEPPEQYLIDSDDVLGIYIEGVLGTSEEAPPVHFPDRGGDVKSDLPPSIGFPIPVREDGTLPLPLISPIPVRGLTLTQVENMIREAYTVDRKILQPGRDRIIVTLIRERTYRVIVVREDGQQELAIPGGGRMQTGRQTNIIAGETRTGTGHVLDLPAYKNDLMHALAETGGLPGLNAKNEVKILRGKRADADKRDEFVRQFYAMYAQNPCMCPPPLPDDPSIIRIPLRVRPGESLGFSQEDIVLEDGDIVYIEGRDTEFFYTGGLLPGGQWPLPRDYDIDVLGAIAVAGQGVGGGQAQGAGLFLVPGVTGATPTQLFVVRQTPCNGQVIIAVDMTRAIRSPRERILIQPGDTIILRYKPVEELLNFGIGTFFTYGLRELISGN